MNYIGIDLGTSSVKGLLMSETFEVLFTSCSDYNNDVNDKGWSEQNPIDWYEQSTLVLKELFEYSDKKIAAISFSGQMHGLVTLDKEDNVIRPAILWNDQRTTKQCEYLNQKVGQENLLKWVGNIALTGYTAPKLLWMYENEYENFKKIHKIMLPKDYLVYRFTNNFVTDYSDASGTLYFDVKHKVWSKEMLDILKISTKQLPKLNRSCEVVGSLQPKLMKKLNINYQVAVVVGGGDQAVGALGTASVEDKTINISLGTSGVVYTPVNEFKNNPLGTVHNFCDATGKYLKMGVALSSGGSMNWWTNKVINNNDFNELESKMQQIPADENLYYLPYLTGERSPINDSDIRATFIGISLHHDRFALTRAIIEGVGFSLYQIYQSLAIDDKDIKIRITGGGAKSNLWVQVIANIYNQNIEIIEATEGPALGAAYLAIAGIKKIDVTDIATENLNVIKIVSPDHNRDIYQKKYKKWLKLYPEIKKISFN